MDEDLGLTALRHKRIYDDVRSAQIKPRNPACPVGATVVIGPPGIGKTRAAHALASRWGDVFVHWNGTFWDGYSGQPIVIFDDVQGDEMSWSEWLKVLDCYPHKVNIKGSSCELSTRFFILTANTHPNNWTFRQKATYDMGAFERRVKVREYTGSHTHIDISTDLYTDIVSILEEPK